MKEKSVPKRQYTEEFRVEAIRLAESVGQHEASRRLGVPVATVGNWVRQRQKTGGSSDTNLPVAGTAIRRPVGEMEAEISRLRKELASARLDIEILRKATAYFAKGSR